MGLPNKDEVKGAFDRAKGSVKEAVGDATGDDQLSAEGHIDQAKGNVRQSYGEGRRKVGEAIEDIGEDLKR